MAERGAFLRGEGNLFLAEKRFPSPLKLPPSFQKPLIYCFAPQGNPCSGTYGARKNQGKMPQGTAILSVKSRPGKCPSGGDAGRAETRPLHPRKKRTFPSIWPPGDIWSAFLFPQAKSKPSASSYGPVTSGHARQCHTIKKRLPLRAAFNKRVFGEEGVPPSLYLS